MNSIPAFEPVDGERRAESLMNLLEQSRRAKQIVQECARDLSTVNSDIHQELENEGSLPGVERALKKNEALEDKVHAVSAKLSAVNVDLKDQVRDRVMLETRFAVAVEQEEVARHMALHDDLTDLPNRALFDDRLTHGLAHAKRHGWTMAVMFIDIDDFKSSNDVHGQDVGDRVLQIIAQRLASNTRIDDTVSRCGGDEFLFLLSEAQNEADISRAAGKIAALVRAPCDIACGGMSTIVVVKASIGISIFPKDGSTAEMLVRKADSAMYHAKQNHVAFSFSAQAQNRPTPLR